MNAIVVAQYGGPEVLHLQTIPELHPGPGQVLIRVAAAGVNPVEAYVRAGSQGYMTHLPYTPGSDAAGEIIAIGPGVKTRKLKERVFTLGTLSGAYAQEVLCSEDQVHPLPADLTFNQGAALGIPYATAYRALFQSARALPGETVFIHGASGGVGMAAIQWAKMHSLKIISSASGSIKAKFLHSLGADHVVDHQKENHIQDVLQLTQGRGADIILEMLANKNLGQDLTGLAQGGRVIVIGSRGPVEINPRELMRREAMIRGVITSLASPAEKQEIRDALQDGFQKQALVPIVTDALPLSQAFTAHEKIMDSAHFGKIVLLP